MTPKKKKEINTHPSKIEKESNLKKIEESNIEWKRRTGERTGPLKFRIIEGGKIAQIEEDLSKFWPLVKETTGSSDVDFLKKIMGQVGATLPTEKTEVAANFIAALMYGLRPRDEMEGVLIAQMVGTHNLIMEYMGKAVVPGQNIMVTEDYTNRVYKLMNIFLKQVEALQKYRGKAAQQKVTVEHVHIHKGGQAVVGHIDNRLRGEGENGKK